MPQAFTFPVRSLHAVGIGSSVSLLCISGAGAINEVSMRPSTLALSSLLHVQSSMRIPSVTRRASHLHGQRQTSLGCTAATLPLQACTLCIFTTFTSNVIAISCGTDVAPSSAKRFTCLWIRALARAIAALLVTIEANKQTQTTSSLHICSIFLPFSNPSPPSTLAKPLQDRNTTNAHHVHQHEPEHQRSSSVQRFLDDIAS